MKRATHGDNVATTGLARLGVDRRILPLLLLLTLWSPHRSWSYVDEAHSAVMEVVAGLVDEGFTIRADYWNGALESGTKKLIRHQLFRGNDYWFWVATSTPGCEVKIEVYNEDGVSVTVERSSSGTVSGARVTPAATDSYYVLIRLSAPGTPDPESDPVMIDWALVYGYR